MSGIRARAKPSLLYDAGPLFIALVKRAGLPEPRREYYFARPQRRWRFDYAWPDQKLALEVEGGAWTNGRHTRGAGFLADIAKYNDATLRGWRLLRVSPSQLIDLQTMTMLERALRSVPSVPSVSTVERGG